MTKGLTAAAAALAAVVVGLWLWSRPATGGSAQAAGASSAISGSIATAPSTKPLAESAAVPDTDLSLLEVRAWQGTDQDGDIHLDSGGHIIPDLALRQLFDYLLSALNQLDPAQIALHLDNAAQSHRLNAVQTSELQGLYAAYVDYLKAAAEIPVESNDLAGLQHIYDTRYRLRRSVLGGVAADGYFAGNEAEDRYTLEKIAITRNKQFSATQREQQLAAARALAPAAIRASEDQAAALATLSAGTEALRRQGADAAQLQALRERTVGSEAAARLTALDQEDAAWGQRLQAFEAARRQIESSQGLSEQDRRQQRDALIARDFSPPEALRLRAQLGLDSGAR